MVVSGVVAGALIRKMGPRIPLIIGAAAVAASFTILALGHSEGWQIIVSGLLTGVGIGMALAATSNAIVENVPAAQTGEAIGANTVLTAGPQLGRWDRRREQLRADNRWHSHTLLRAHDAGTDRTDDHGQGNLEWKSHC